MSDILTDDDHIRLTVAVLSLAADRFGNHGCNDFDLRKVDGFQDPAKQRELDRLQCASIGDPKDHDPERDRAIGDDWAIMAYLAKWWRQRTGPAILSKEQERAAAEAERVRELRILEGTVARRKREAETAERELTQAEAELAAARQRGGR